MKIDKHTSYSHSTSIADFQSAIATVLEDDLTAKISRGLYSIMLDESTDVSVQQNLIVYVRILEADALGYFSPQTYFLGIEGIERANSVCIYTMVLFVVAASACCCA